MTAHSIWASMVVLALCNPVLASERAVWIDADPSCAIGPTHDVDDCWAIIAALRADSLQIIGLSTVFGNTDVAKATATAQALLEIVQTHEPWTPPANCHSRRAPTNHAPDGSPGRRN